MQFCAFDVVPFGQHYSPGPVSEQDTCSSVFPAGHSGRLLDACDDRVLDFPGLVVCLRHVKRIDESRTRAVDVEHRTFKPQFLSDDAAHPRGDIFGNNIGDDEKVNVFSLQSGHLKSLADSLGPEVLKVLVRDHMPCLYPGARVDPLVACVKKSGKHVVCHDLSGKRASRTDDFHIFTNINVFSPTKI